MLDGVERVKDAASPNSESQTYESRRTRRGDGQTQSRTKLNSDIERDRRKQQGASAWNKQGRGDIYSGLSAVASSGDKREDIEDTSGRSRVNMCTHPTSFSYHSGVKKINEKKARIQQLHLAARHKVGHGGEKEARLNELRLIARRRLGLDPEPIEETKANYRPSPEQPQRNMEVINNMKDGTLAAPQGCVRVPRVVDKILSICLLPNEGDPTKTRVSQGPVASHINLPKESKTSYIHPAVHQDSHCVSDVISGHGHFDNALFGQDVAENICPEISVTNRASRDLTSSESDQDGDTKVKETNIRAVTLLEAQWEDRGGKLQDKISVDRKIFCTDPDESEPLVSHSTKSEIFKADKFLPSTGLSQEDGSGHFDNTSSGQGVAETICREISATTQASRDLTSTKNDQDGNTKVEQKNTHIVVQSMAQYKDGGEKAQGKISVERKIFYTDPGEGEPLSSHSIKLEILKDDRFIPSTGLVQANGSNDLCGAGCNPLKQYEGSRKKSVHERKEEGGSDFLCGKDLSADQKNPAKKPTTCILHNQDDTSEGGEGKKSNERETTLRHRGDGSIDGLSISTNDTSESSIIEILDKAEQRYQRMWQRRKTLAADGVCSLISTRSSQKESQSKNSPPLSTSSVSSWSSIFQPRAARQSQIKSDNSGTITRSDVSEKTRPTPNAIALSADIVVLAEDQSFYSDTSAEGIGGGRLSIAEHTSQLEENVPKISTTKGISSLNIEKSATHNIVAHMNEKKLEGIPSLTTSMLDETARNNSLSVHRHSRPKGNLEAEATSPIVQQKDSTPQHYEKVHDLARSMANEIKLPIAVGCSSSDSVVFLYEMEIVQTAR